MSGRFPRGLPSRIPTDADDSARRGRERFKCARAPFFAPRARIGDRAKGKVSRAENSAKPRKDLTIRTRVLNWLFYRIDFRAPRRARSSRGKRKSRRGSCEKDLAGRHLCERPLRPSSRRYNARRNETERILSGITRLLYHILCNRIAPSSPYVTHVASTHTSAPYLRG